MLFSWEKLSEIFTFSYFRYLGWWFAVTPVAISVISGVKENNYFNIKSISLPFSWEILWISSLFYVSGYILFFICCPSFIKKYKNLQTYEKLMFPNDYILEEWLCFIKKFKTIDDFSSNKVIKNLLQERMRLEIEFNNYPTEEEKKENKNKILRSYYHLMRVYLNCTKHDYIFFPVETDANTKVSDEVIFKKYYLYLNEVYEGERIIGKKIISYLLVVSLIFFAAILCQNIYHAFIYIYFDLRENFSWRKWWPFT